MLRKPIKSDSRFGRWTTTGEYKIENHITFYECMCDCGKIKFVRGTQLRNGRSSSCGCLAIDKTVEASTTHGESKKNRLYGIWQAIRRRCLRPGHSAYKKYGGTGITICSEWDTWEGFRNWALENGYLDNLSIDRIDNSKGYYPENCRWANAKVQANNKSNNILITAFGETKTSSYWVIDSRCKCSQPVLLSRIRSGWNHEEAITKPADSRPSRNITAFGETKNLSEWSRDKKCKVHRKTLERRIRDGWEPEIAITDS